MRTGRHPHALVVCAAALAACAHASAQELPEPRAHHQLVYHEGEQRVFLVGGSTPRDGELIGRGGPPPRISSQLAFDGTGVVLFGGRTRTGDGFRDLNDTWRLHGRNWVRMQ